MILVHSYITDVMKVAEIYPKYPKEEFLPCTKGEFDEVFYIQELGIRLE